MNIFSLIKEEVNNFLNEFAETDVVDSRNIDLQKEYDELNKLLWDNKLPNVHLLFDSKKNGYGRVVGFYNRRTGEVSIKHLAISNMYKYTYRQFRNILAHEQIHVYQMGVLKNKGGHGWDFHREANRINGMGLEFEITEKNGEDIAVSDQAMARFSKKNLIALVINTDGRYSITVTTPSVYAKESDQFFHIFDLTVNRYYKYNKVEITVIETSNPELLKYPIARTFMRRVSSIPLPDRLLEQLLNDNIIKEIKISRGVPMSVSEEIQEEVNAGEWERIEMI